GGFAIVIEPAALEDIAAALIQLINGLFQTLDTALFPVGILQYQRGVLAVVLQVVRRCHIVAVFVGALGGVKSRVKGRQPALHVAHMFYVHVQVGGNGLGLVVGEPGQAFFGAAQVKEQFALGLGGGDFYNAP